MTRYEAATAYWTMWLPSITFGFSSTTMNYRQLDAIQKPMIDAILPKMGYSSKMTRDVVFRPRKYLGMGLHHLGPEQGVQQTLLLLKHIRANQQLSTLLRIGLSWFQLHAGINQQILECPDIEVPYLETGCKTYSWAVVRFRMETTRMAPIHPQYDTPQIPADTSGATRK
jgi:hypothetical protein